MSQHRALCYLTHLSLCSMLYLLPRPVVYTFEKVPHFWSISAQQCIVFTPQNTNYIWKAFCFNPNSAIKFLFLFNEKRNTSKLPKCMLTEGVSPICSATGYNSYAESDHLGWVSIPGSRLCLLSLVIHVPTASILHMQPQGLQDVTVHLNTLCCLKVELSKSYHYV